MKRTMVLLLLGSMLVMTAGVSEKTGKKQGNRQQYRPVG